MPAAKSITINFDTNISKVSYKNEMFVWTNGETKYGFDWSDVFTVTLNSGYIIDTVTATHTSVKSQTDTTFTINNDIAVGVVITITSKAASSQKSYDLSTSSKWSTLSDGEHTVQIVAKGTGYRDSAKSTSVTVTKGSSTVTLEAGTYQFVESPVLPDFDIEQLLNFVSNENVYQKFIISSESINFYDGNSNYFYEITIGWNSEEDRTITLETDQQVSQEFYDWAITQGNLVRQTSTGETWVLNETIYDSTDFEYNANFVSNEVDYQQINCNTMLGAIGYLPKDSAYSTVVYKGGWKNNGYRTITFSTATTGDLLTWLQANGTKQCNLIEFTIDDTSYQAEQGMTWQQWVDSSYNTSNGRYFIQDGYLNWTGGSIAGPTANSSLANPKASDAPQNNGVYYENISGGNTQ